MISVIVPIYNEETVLFKNRLYFQRLSQKADLVFVDGGSSDRSREFAARFGRVLSAKKGRAAQMNYGAVFAREETLLFLHADNCVLTPTFRVIENMLSQGACIGGCLTQRINGRFFIYRLIELLGNLRARISRVFYGDQAIFVKKDWFIRIKGFPEVPIMEDVMFTKRLRRCGKTVVLKNRVFVSARRWQKNGVIRTGYLYFIMSILFKAGFPLEKIKAMYEDLR